MIRIHDGVPAFVAISLLVLPAVSFGQVTMVIDWSVCKQPDLTSQDHVKAVQGMVDKYFATARSDKSVHVAVGLNRVYGQAVQDRRDHVRLNYIPIGPNRTEKQCALSDKNYAMLIAYRDASYYVLCRSEVAIGGSEQERARKDLQALAYSAIYDFLKSIGADFRAKADEPTTPPGGYAACKRGADDGKKDTIPTAESMQGFKTRLNLPDSEKAKLGDPSKQ